MTKVTSTSKERVTRASDRPAEVEHQDDEPILLFVRVRILRSTFRAAHLGQPYRGSCPIQIGRLRKVTHEGPSRRAYPGACKETYPGTALCQDAPIVLKKSALLRV